MNKANPDVRKCSTVSPRKFWFMFAKVPGFGTFANGTFAAPYCTCKTVKFDLICLPDTKQKSKNRFSQITYFGHVTSFDEKVFVQGGV